jgi:hypothetical protein
MNDAVDRFFISCSTLACSVRFERCKMKMKMSMTMKIMTKMVGDCSILLIPCHHSIALLYHCHALQFAPGSLHARHDE